MEEEREKIDIKKHKELFKILPEQEYSLLEQALEKGLYITPFEVKGEGKEILNIDENITKALPSLYEGFKKTETLQKKQEAIKVKDKSFKRFLDLSNWPEGLGIIDMMTSLVSVMVGGFSLGLGKLPASLAIPLIIYGIPGAVSYNIIAAVDSDKHVPLLTPIALAASSTFYLQNRVKKRRKTRFERKLAKQKAKVVADILTIKQGTIEPEEFNYIKNIDTIKNDDKLTEMFEKRDKGLRELLDIVLNKDIEEYREKIDLLKGVALEEASKIELEPKTLKPFSDYCGMLGLDMRAIRKEIGKRGNEVFQAVHCPLVTPKAKQATQKPALDKELSEWAGKYGLASLDMFFEQPECIDDTLLQRKVMDISDSIVRFPKKDGAGKEDVEPLKEYYKTAKKAIEGVGKKLGCDAILVDDYDELLLNSIMYGVEELYKEKKARTKEFGLPSPPSSVPEIQVKTEQKQAEEELKPKKEIEKKKRVLEKEW